MGCELRVHISVLHLGGVWGHAPPQKIFFLDSRSSKMAAVQATINE